MFGKASLDLVVQNTDTMLSLLLIVTFLERLLSDSAHMNVDEALQQIPKMTERTYIKTVSAVED